MVKAFEGHTGYVLGVAETDGCTLESGRTT
jgi:hypothetical protein